MLLFGSSWSGGRAEPGRRKYALSAGWHCRCWGPAATTPLLRLSQLRLQHSISSMFAAGDLFATRCKCMQSFWECWLLTRAQSSLLNHKRQLCRSQRRVVPAAGDTDTLCNISST